MNDRYFPYQRDERWKKLFDVLHLKTDDGVTLTALGTDDAMFTATFGRWKVRTPIANIDHTAITGPHRWYTAVGVRLSFSDDGLTFGTNHQRGICVAFKERIPRVVGPRRHSALWVSVADPDGLAAALGC